MTQPMTYQSTNVYVVQDSDGKVVGKARHLDARAIATHLFTPAHDYLSARHGSTSEQLQWLDNLKDVTQ